MDLTVVLAVLLAAAMHAGWNAAVKGSSGDPHAASTGLALCWAVLGWPVVWLVGPLAAEVWPVLLASVAVHLVYFTVLGAAYRDGDLSLVYPLARGVPPLLVAIGSGWALGETLSPLAVLGVVTIAGGVLAMQPAIPRGPAARVVALALVSAACTAAYTLLDGGGARAAGDPWVYTAHLVALQGTLFAAGALARGGRPLLAAVWERRGVALGAGLLSACGYAVALWAMTEAPIAVVAALRETSVLFAAWLGQAVLGERLGRRRILATALVAVGAVCVRIAG